MIFISPDLKLMAKGTRDNLLYGNKKVTPTMVQDMEKQKEILRKLAETKIKLNK
jgi:hypothetical protein